MLRTLRARLQLQNGFTLIELLIVILLLGILATIALPAFIGEQTRGHDASAKSNARNVVSSVESCFSETKSYETCDTIAELQATDTTPGVELTDTTAKKKGAVSVTASEDTYEIAGYSMSDHVFVISKAADGNSTRNW